MLDCQKIEALVCIRNAVVHNDGDLSKNHDQNSLNKVISANYNYDPRKCLFDGTIVLEIPFSKKLEILKHLEFLNISTETLGLKI